MAEFLADVIFDWPLVALALPLPWLVRTLLPAAPEPQDALYVPTLAPYDMLGTGAARRRRLPLLALTLVWCLSVLAATRPVWLGEPVALPLSGRELMLAVDLSESMKQADFEIGGRLVDRLTASKVVARDFIGRRAGDRIGLIVFADQAYLQAPLTQDLRTVTTLLDETVIGLAGRQTAIGDAIGIAVKRLAPAPGDTGDIRNRVLILMTDGANTAGEIDPLTAADLAAEAGLRIHTIGIGADEQTVRTLFGTRRINPSLDLDEETLTAIAEKTGGRYFRARDTRQLAGIYAEIDRLEPVVGDPDFFRPRRELYPWPLGAALALAGLWLLGSRVGRLGDRGDAA